jgi:hypothetical protein
VSTPMLCCHAIRILPQLGDQADRPFGPDPHLQHVLVYVNTLDQELDDPGLLGRKSSFQTVAKSASWTETSWSVISPSRVGGSLRPSGLTAIRLLGIGRMAP